MAGVGRDPYETWDFRDFAKLSLGFGSDFETSRAHWMNRSATELNVRFFNVTTATGHGRIGNSTGNIFKASRFVPSSMSDLGRAVMNEPQEGKFVRKCTDVVTRVTFGAGRPWSRNISATRS
jgi:hypothetical protein